MIVTPIKRGGLNWIIHLTIRARWDVQVPRVSLVQLARKETEDFRVHPEIVEYKDHRSVMKEFLILITMKPRNDINEPNVLDTFYTFKIFILIYQLIIIIYYKIIQGNPGASGPAGPPGAAGPVVSSQSCQI